MKHFNRQDLRAFQACARNCDRAVIVLQGNKRVRWMTEPARQCVAEFFGHPPRQGNCLPRPMVRWIERRPPPRHSKQPAFHRSTVLERNGEQLVVHLVTDKREGIQLLQLGKLRPALSAQSLERLGLSHRETEVLGWLARGKTNAEIGTALGLSRFTVRKHLEHIYQKLGVETRTAAAAMAYGESPAPCMGELESN